MSLLVVHHVRLLRKEAKQRTGTRISAIDPSVYSTMAMPALTKSSTAAIASGIPVRAATVSTSIA